MDRVLLDEVWIPIPEWEGLYSASDRGRIRSEERRVASPAGSRRVRLRILRPNYHNTPYQHVDLSRNNEPRNFTVHTLILVTFKGPCPQGLEACHDDGDPDNNSASNLRWDSCSSNARDRLKHGTARIGEKVHTAKLTSDQVLRIRDEGKSHSKYSEIGLRYGVSGVTVGNIVRRETWKHL